MLVPLGLPFCYTFGLASTCNTHLHQRCSLSRNHLKIFEKITCFTPRHLGNQPQSNLNCFQEATACVLKLTLDLGSFLVGPKMTPFWHPKATLEFMKNRPVRQACQKIDRPKTARDRPKTAPRPLSGETPPRCGRSVVRCCVVFCAVLLSSVVWVLGRLLRAGEGRRKRRE